jgi:transcriptional regulator with XRE-family HTH domain
MTEMSDNRLGSSVRRLRESRQLTLRTLAERTGFSPSFLSQVENNQASPSIASMERIAAALGVTLGEFFQGTHLQAAPVVRSEERPVLHSGWSHAVLESLSVAGSRLHPVLVTLNPGGSSGAQAYASGAEEFALVLDGEVVLTLGDTEHALATEDAVTVGAGTLRRWTNRGKQPARILIVSAR